MRVVLTGIYNDGEIRTGSEEVAVSVFRELQKHTETFFITKYSMIKPHTFWEKLFGLKQKKNLYYVGFLRMPFVIKKLNPDILHGVNYHPFVGLVFGWFGSSNTKLCYTVNGVVAYENSKKRYLTAAFKLSRHYTEKLIFRNSDLLFVFDQQTRLQIQELYGFEKKKYNLIENGVSEILFLDSGQRTSGSKGLSLVALAGLMDRIHGIEFLFDALISADINFTLKILGETEHLVVPQTLRSKVAIAGKISHDDFIRVLDTCDVYVCLSLYESFSISTAEAMARGCTVLVSEKIGISQYITHGIDGFVVSPENIIQIKKLLKLLFDDSELRKRTGLAARETAKRFSWPKIAKSYFTAYEGLVKHA